MSKRASENTGRKASPERNEMQQAESELQRERQMEAALVLLASGNALAEVANEVGVHRTTLWRWLQDPEYAARVESETTSLRAQARRRLIGAAELAIATLEGICKDPKKDDEVRRKAANDLLERVLPADVAPQNVSVLSVTTHAPTPEEAKAFIRTHGRTTNVDK